MRSRRVYPDRLGRMELQPGEYGNMKGIWWVHPPHPNAGVIPFHNPGQVTEHTDGTISVHGPVEAQEWRGYLEHGHWRPAGEDG